MYRSLVFTGGMLACLTQNTVSHAVTNLAKVRTVVTTDMESDDLASLVRYVLYSNELENQGLIYTSSKYHWEGDGNGTKFFLPNREYNTSQTSWRPTGTTTIEDYLLKAYQEVFPNLRCHDPAYPKPQELLAITKVGNVDFEGEMAKDTDGSNLIKELLLDDDRRTLYLQAWGGTNTIARALKSIEDQHSSSRQWPRIKDFISKKAVILASGFQDETYTEYIAPNWPSLRVEEFSAAYHTWGFNCNNGQGNIRGLPDNSVYYQGEWTEDNILVGPLGSLYRSWLDGQTTFGGGDQLDIFGDPMKAPSGWCKPTQKYDFLSEGDNVVFNPLLTTGLQVPSNPTFGGWGGRSKQNSTSPDLWILIDKEQGKNGSQVDNWTTGRWVAAAQNDFAARMQWTRTPQYSKGNHAPLVKVVSGTEVTARAGSIVRLSAQVSDPDNDGIAVSWWQYVEEGTYPGTVAIVAQANTRALVTIPTDARSGQTVSVIVQVTDDGELPLTRYARISIQIV